MKSDSYKKIRPYKGLVGHYKEFGFYSEMESRWRVLSRREI